MKKTRPISTASLPKGTTRITNADGIRMWEVPGFGYFKSKRDILIFFTKSVPVMPEVNPAELQILAETKIEQAEADA